MKKLNKTLSIILSVIMILSLIPLTVSAAATSGKWGNTATWSLNINTGVLTISGTGNTKNYQSQEKYVPWYDYRALVTSVYIEEGVTSIGQNAFNMCEFLKDVSIPLSLTRIIERTLPQVETIYYSGTKEQWRALEIKNLYQFSKYSQACCSDGILLPLENMCGANVMWELDENTGLLTISGTGDMFDYGYVWDDASNIFAPWYSIKDKITDVYIEKGVTSIGAIAFASCKSLKSVTISEGVTEIGELAFSSCPELKYLAFPLSLTKINYNVIPDITLNYPGTKAQWLDLVNKSESDFFYRKVICSDGELLPLGACGEDLIWTYDYDNKKLTISGTGEMFDYSIEPDGFGVIDTRPWYELKNIINVVEIEEGVTNIGKHAFEDCEDLVEAQIPSTVTKIGASAFCECRGLEGITIPEGVTEIGTSAFYQCTSLKNITIPNGVTKIASGAFDWSGLESVVIPDSVTELGSAFEACKSLKRVVIGEGITKIGNYAFSDCESLSTVEMSNNVTEIGENAFEDCKKLSKFRVSTSLKRVKASAFTRANTPTLIFSGEKEELLNIYVESGNSAFVSGVCYFDNGEIGGIYGNGSIWCYDENTSTVTISGEGEMYSYATLRYPGYKKFKPKNTVFVEGVRSISNCPDDVMQTVVLADSVQVIHFGAFSECENLSKVYYAGSEEQWEQIEIYDDNAPLLNATIVYNYCMHEYSPTETMSATCTEYGYTKYTCQYCDSYYFDYTANPTGHTFNDEGVCETCGEKEVTNTSSTANSQMLSLESILAMIINILAKILGMFTVA